MSNGRKPVIGLSLGLHDFGDYAGVGFQRPVALAGGVGLALPRVEGHLEDALDVCDGILLGGGRDIDPGRYGQEPTEHLAPTEPIRDAFELELTERALDRGLPILGMCRGIQILNVALGGTLIQDIPSTISTNISHDDEGPRDSRTHEISVEPGSLIARAIGTEHATVNSFHHQSVQRVADGMKITAKSPDGVIEGIESTDRNWWVMGVQWHPEEMTGSAEPWDRGLFRAFARKLEA